MFWFITTMATKRKHCEVTLKVKYNALKELEKGRLNKDVAEEFKIPSSTLATWKKNKDKIFTAFGIDYVKKNQSKKVEPNDCLLYTSPSPRDRG